MPAIEKSAMIANLTIKHWNPLVKDENVTGKVEADYAIVKRGYWNKWKVAKSSIDPIRQIINTARKFHYENTLPWDDCGNRLLPTKNYQEYTAGMRSMKAQFDAAVNKFVTNFVNHINEAQAELGTMFNSADYPDPAEIQSFFMFDTTLNPVPVGNDFRCEMNKDDIAEIQEQISEQNTAAISGAVEELWSRLEDVVTHAAKSLGDKDKIFRNTLISNIDKIADMIPRLNFSGDKELETLAKEAKEKVAQYSPKFLRNNVNVRRQAAADAAAVKTKISKKRPARKKKGSGNDSK